MHTIRKGLLSRLSTISLSSISSSSLRSSSALPSHLSFPSSSSTSSLLLLPNRSLSWLSRFTKKEETKTPPSPATDAAPSVGASTEIPSPSTAVSALPVPFEGVPFNTPSESSSFLSAASKTEAAVTLKDIPISPIKLQAAAKRIVGLSVDEALVQIALSRKPRSARALRKALLRTVTTAVNNFHMNRERLFISTIQVMKGTYKKELEIKARTNYGIIHRYAAHLRIFVREAPIGETVSQRDVRRMNQEYSKPKFDRWGKLRRTIAELEAQEAQQEQLKAELDAQPKL